MDTSSASERALELEKILLRRLKERPVRTDLTPVEQSLSDFSLPTKTTVVQVVGTNGKGSVVHYLSQLLTDMGEEVVSYTSPHFHHPSERFRINNSSISRDRFRELLTDVSDRLDEDLTPFETLVVISVALAEIEQPDYLLLEAGMGGRWDATSAIGADLTILTSVGLEHAEYLGDSKTEITGEKTAQIPTSSTLLTGPLDPESDQVIQQQVRRKELDHVTIEGTGSIQETMKRLAGRAVEELTGTPLSELSLDELSPPAGRLDHRVSKGIDYLLDVAHTSEAVGHVLKAVKQRTIKGDLYAVFGCLAGKDMEAMVEKLLEVVHRDRILLTKPPSERALNPATDSPVSLNPSEPYSPPEAATYLQSETSEDDLVLVTGSFDLVGWFLEHIEGESP